MVQRLSASLVKYKKHSSAQAIECALADKFARVYDPVTDYGADPTGQRDSWAQIQACIDAAIADRWAIFNIQGIFQISQPLIGRGVQGLTVLGNCYVYPTYDEGECVWGWCNGAGLRTLGRIEVSGQNKKGIKAGHKFWTDMSPNGFSFSYMTGLCASDVLRGVQFGDERYPNGLVSEMTLIGGYSVGTPCAVYAVGTQTYINCTSFDAVSGGAGDLANVTQYTIHVKGAQVKFMGGEIQHNNNIYGAAVLVEPITDPNHGNSYGNFSSVHSHIETASQLCLIANFDGVQNTISDRTRVSFIGSHGFHNQNNGGFINVHLDTAAEYAGTIHYRDLSFFTTDTVRTQPNVVAGVNTIVDPCPGGFGKGFVNGMQGIRSGIVLFPNMAIFRAANCNGQAMPAGSATVLNYTEVRADDDTTRWSANYSNGSFTVPHGGLKDVRVVANFRAPVDRCQIDVYVDGNLMSLEDPQGTAPKINLSLGSLNAGQVITVRGTSPSASNTNGGGLEGITIYARR